jgi:hypothetical protein
MQGGQKVNRVVECEGCVDKVVVEPQGKFETDVTIGNGLTPGEYQVYLHMYHSVGPLSGRPGPASERFDFDVVDKDVMKKQD